MIQTVYQISEMVNSLFKQVTIESVTSTFGNEVAKRIRVEEEYLEKCQHHSISVARTSHLQENEQVGSFVFRFLEHVMHQ